MTAQKRRVPRLHEGRTPEEIHRVETRVRRQLRVPLTDGQVKAARAGRGGLPNKVEIPDHGARGLVLRVLSTGVKTFVFTKMKQRKRYTFALGQYPTLGLADARVMAARLLTLIGKVDDDEIRARIAAGDLDTPTKPEVEQGDTLEDLVNGWLKDAAAERSDKTMEAYRGAAERFLAWAKSAKVKTAANVGRAQLSVFRAWLVALPRHSSAKGGERGKKVATGGKRSPASINRELRSIKTMLGELRRAGKLPQLNSDAIADTLPMVKSNRVKPSRLKTPQIKRLLEACDRHDAATFKATRDGETDAARHVPVKPFVVFMLLTGMRLSEALSLTWDQVDLDTTDHDGRPIGEIELRAEDVKTKRDRTVYLDVCPTVRKMLAAMRLASGGEGRVWAGYTEDVVSGARHRLAAEYGAPVFLWSVQHSKGGERSPPTLRATCATYLHCSNIYGAQGIHLACAQLGHSVDVARDHYAGVEKSIPRDARTLETAMRVQALIGNVAPAAPAAPAKPSRRRRLAAVDG